MTPIATGPAVALLGAGGAVLVTAGLVAALSRRQRGSAAGWLLGLGVSMCALGGFALLLRYA